MTDHETIEFWKREFTDVTDVTIELPIADRDSILVTSTCPACKWTGRNEYRRGAPYGFKGRDGAPPLANPVTIRCACGYQHANRPSGTADYGCGAFWKVDLP